MAQIKERPSAPRSRPAARQAETPCSAAVLAWLDRRPPDFAGVRRDGPRSLRQIAPHFEEVRLLAPHIADALRDRAAASFDAPPPV